MALIRATPAVRIQSSARKARSQLLSLVPPVPRTEETDELSVSPYLLRPKRELWQVLQEKRIQDPALWQIAVTRLNQLAGEGPGSAVVREPGPIAA
jgi:hypothetical protein